jgi:hypothetical protein
MESRMNSGIVRISPSSKAERAFVKLPEPARRKLQHLTDAKNDAWVLIKPVQDDLSALLGEKERLEARERTLLGDVRIGRRGEENSLVIATRAELARLEPEIDRLRDQVERRTKRWQSLAGLVDDIVLWIDRITDETEFALFDVVDSSASPTSEMIDSIRDVIAGLRADIHTVMSAPIPIAQQKVAMRAQVKQLAEQGRPDCEALLAHGGDIVWPHKRTAVWSSDKMNVSATSVDDVPAMLAWLFEPALVKALDREIDQIATNDSEALDDNTRARRLTELHSEILKNERVEEAMIVAAGERGMDVLRRRDADPRAVLGLADDVSPDGR